MGRTEGRRTEENSSELFGEFGTVFFRPSPFRPSFRLFSVIVPRVDDSIVINSRISIPMSAVTIQFARASGPGGQNVNRVETAVELTFDLMHSPLFMEMERQRALSKLKSHADSDGVVHVVAQSERSQLRNREEATRRFAQLLRDALVIPKRRRATKPTRGSVEQRLAGKRRDSQIKRTRQRLDGE